MRDILPDLENWHADKNGSIALATVIQTWGSSPRAAGAKMALTPDGKITGSVSGGCVEGAVFEAGVEALKSRRPKLLHFGIADETAWEVGLACGGTIDIFVKPLDPELFRALRSEVVAEHPVVLVTIVRGPDDLLGRGMLVRDDGSFTGSLDDELNKKAVMVAKEALAQGVSRRAPLG